MVLHAIPENVTGFASLFQYANNTIIADGLGVSLGIIILVCIFFITFISFKAFTTERAFLGAAYITLVATFFLRILELVGDKTLFVAVILAAIATAVMFIENSELVSY